MRKILAVLALLLYFPAQAQVRLARLFSDHVVLQRQKPIPVWGWAKPDEKIKVVLAGQTQSTKTDKSGKWTVTFNPLEAGGPYVLTVSGKSENLSVQDILIGEVWLCSGQSNMEWRVAQANNFQEEKKNADFPQIRHFKVEHKVTLEPEKDLETGDWKVASSETVGDFSAVGFFFARELYQKLKVPIGLVHSSWGGSQVEGWISKEAMLSDPGLRNYAQNLPTTWEKADVIMDNKLRKQLFKNTAVNPTADDEKQYVSGNASFSNWQKTDNPIGQWDWKGLMGFRGQGYMAKEIEISGDLAGKTSVLTLPENDSPNQIYINGKLVASETVKGPKKIKLPENTWKAGKNQLVIKLGGMVEMSWFGPGFSGSLNDLYIEGNGQKTMITGDWYLMPSFAEPHVYAHLMNNVGTTISNAMIVPLIPFAMRGVLWYQGESNAGRAYQYRQSFPLMINDWRKLWNDNFSFYWVQLSTFGPENNSNTGSNWGELREAQNMTLQLPNTGMAVSTDIGNPKDIHPTNKQDVGHRLATNALKLNYGMDIPYASPLYDAVSFDGNSATISFKYAENGLMIKDKYGYLKGFEIAGDDKVFHFAKAEIKGNKVVVYSDKVSKPVSVRYAWSDSPVDANLFSVDGFPVSGFRTDTWPGITINNKFE